MRGRTERQHTETHPIAAHSNVASALKFPDSAVYRSSPDTDLTTHMGSVPSKLRNTNENSSKHLKRDTMFMAWKTQHRKNDNSQTNEQISSNAVQSPTWTSQSDRRVEPKFQVERKAREVEWLKIYRKRRKLEEPQLVSYNTYLL